MWTEHRTKRSHSRPNLPALKAAWPQTHLTWMQSFSETGEHWVSQVAGRFPPSRFQNCCTHYAANASADGHSVSDPHENDRALTSPLIKGKPAESATRRLVRWCESWKQTWWNERKQEWKNWNKRNYDYFGLDSCLRVKDIPSQTLWVLARTWV